MRSVTNDTYTFPKVRNDLMTAYNGNNCNVSSLSVGESGGFSGNSKVGGCTSGLSFKSVTSGFASVQILPEFPTYENFSRFLEPNVTEDQFLSLLTMYRAHSERMMESINKFHFVEVRIFFFKKGPPFCDLIFIFFRIFVGSLSFQAFLARTSRAHCEFRRRKINRLLDWSM